MKTLACHNFKILSDLAPAYFSNINSNHSLPNHFTLLEPQRPSFYSLNIYSLSICNTCHSLYMNTFLQSQTWLALKSSFRSQPVT